MAPTIPSSLKQTMREEIAKQALIENDFASLTNFRRIGAERGRFILWDVIKGAHDIWRNLPEVKQIALSEGYVDYLNLLLRAELAGPEVSTIWASRLKKSLQELGFDFEQEFHEAGYEAQMSWLGSEYWDTPKVVLGAFLEGRRHFVEEIGLVSVDTLYEYVTSPRNDVMAVNGWTGSSEEETCRIRTRVQQRLYITGTNESWDFRLMRKIYQTNGCTPPINW